jgi:hypothetical protein
MPVTRQDVIDVLATCDARELRLVLEAAAVPARGAESPRELAERVANALWWHWCTPAGYAIDKTSLDSIVGRVAKRLKVRDQVGGADAWERLSALNGALATSIGPVRFDELRADQQARARGSIFPSVAWGSGAAGSYGAGAAGRLFLRFAGTPIGRLLPWVPQLAPWFSAIKKGSAIAAVVGTPLSVALGVLAVHQSLGTRWRKVLPLLLSIGALGAHQRVSTAVELP